MSDPLSTKSILPSGRSLDLHRLRSRGVLDAEELRYCREHKIPLGYDCAQIGWVPLSCEDDISDVNQFGIETMARSPVQDPDHLITELKQRLTAELAALAEAFQSDKESITSTYERALNRANTLCRELGSDDVKILDRCHCILVNEVAKQFGHNTLSPPGKGSFKYRRWCDDDVATYYRIMGNPKIWERLPDNFPSPFTMELAQELIEMTNLGDHHQVLAVEHNEEVIGQVRLMFNNSYPDLHSAEIAYLLGEEHWGRGLMPKIVQDFTQRSFAEHEFDFIYAWIEKDHNASIKCAEHAGYRRDTFSHEEKYATATGRSGFQRYICYPNL